MDKIARQELKGALRRLRCGAKMAESDVWAIEQAVKSLIHHESTTVGLWATDRPDLIDDPKGIMFQITSA